MHKLLSQEEVDRRMSEKNLVLLDKYMGINYKHHVQCYCGNKFFPVLSSIFRGMTSSCGCYHKQQTSKRNLKDLTGQRFGRLLVFSQCKNKHKNNNVYWHCLCECGCLHIVAGSSLISGNAQSCGCYKIDKLIAKRNPLDGKKFGKLLVISYSHTSQTGHIMYNCICDCDTKTVVQRGDLVSKHTQSCGNCGIFRNGVKTSFRALELHKMIGRGEHNYNIDVGEKRKINVDIAILDEKIVIEYDEKYWHKNRQDKDNEQTEKLIKNGWYVIRILARGNLPTKKQIDIILQKVYKINPYIIKLDGWGVD